MQYIALKKCNLVNNVCFRDISTCHYSPASCTNKAPKFHVDQKWEHDLDVYISIVSGCAVLCFFAANRLCNKHVNIHLNVYFNILV